MSQPLRDYQERAVRGVVFDWDNGKRRVLLVSPTGSGKTRMGEELVSLEVELHQGRVLWVCHRVELLKQAADRLRLAGLRVGLISPGEPYEPHASVQVATIQSLAARDLRPSATLFIWDEAHHAKAEEWARVAADYPEARHAGLTATPERQDGKPLGDMFDSLVVAAQYSELLKAGHLVQCKVFQPPEIFGNGLAQDPLLALQRYAPPGSRGFVFNASVKLAVECAERMSGAGLRSQPISFKTPAWQRSMFLEQFAQRQLDYLTNMNVLTEGVDVPDANVCMLASACSHVSGFLQKVGRVLRPAADKTHAICIDLSGATLIHGMPTEDRIYSLDGKGIKRTSVAPVKSCPECGATILSAYPACPECGYVFPRQQRKGPRIFDLALVEVYAGAETPADAKRREYKRLRELQKSRGFSLYFVVKSYRDLFGEDPIIDDANDAEKHAEFQKLKALQQSKGFKNGFAAVRFKSMFGAWPARGI
jgi:superfamily II DNA or RNA helicase